mmetsp:Transcript_10566/g.16716  ORF Transcript_10566/g.16716 Transcript_10566/m.16716 type:complete len:388 (-) Transcript_10566:358-1521(-)
MMGMSRKKLYGLVLFAVLVIATLSTLGVRQRIKRRRLDKEHEVEEESKELLAWLEKEGGNHKHVRIQIFDHGGDAVRGLGASDTIAKGQEVLHVPRSLFLEPGGNSMPRELDKQQALLAADLAAEFHQGSDSQYQRYLEALPAREEFEPFHPLYATNEDLTLFSDLKTASAARKKRMILRDAWNKIRTGKPNKDGLQWQGNYDWADFLHAYVLQESRRIELKLTHGGDEVPAVDTLTVVPLVDMINYSGGAANVFFEMVDEGDALSVKTLREVRKGEELLLSTKGAGIASGGNSVFNAALSPDNADFAYRFGVTLGDNPTKITQLDKEVCEGLMSAIEELHAHQDKKHRVRMLFSSLVYESCQELSSPPSHEQKSPQTGSLPLGRGQ